MATSSECPSPSLSSSNPPLSPFKKENLSPYKSQVDELVESRSEILTRIQSLKQDLQNWRSKLETQIKGHHEELTEIRKSLNLEANQIKSEFQELRTTLQQQQEDVTASLRNFGLQDSPKDAGTTSAPAEGEIPDAEASHVGTSNYITSDDQKEAEVLGSST